MNEKELMELVNRMQTACRSNGKYFTQDARLRTIRELTASSSSYHLYKGNLCNVYTKVPVKQLHELDHITLISSHVDTVPNNLFSIVDEEQRLMKGTYDNTITNAACVYLMLHGNLPEHIVFAFTGDEETGGCRGAKETMEFLKRFGVPADRVSVLALDVTYEGYKQRCAFSLENLYSDGSASPLIDYLNEHYDGQYAYAAPFRARIPANLPYEVLSKSPSWFDEGAAYARMNVEFSASFCMPCQSREGHNDMHSEEGVLVHTDAFLSYINALGDTARDLQQILTMEREKEGEEIDR